jgi:integrase/recombinase XerD
MPRLACLRACASGQLAQCRSVMHDNESVPAQPALLLHADRLRLAVAAYLARFKGTSRDHADSDLRCHLTWCAGRGLDPFLARRRHLELHIRVDPGGPPVQALDGLPAVPGDRRVLPGLAGLRIFEATGADIGVGDEHGHRVLRVCGKGGKVVLVPLPPAAGRAIDRAADHRDCGPVLLSSHRRRMDRHAATRRLRRLAETAGIQISRTHPHMIRHTFVTTRSTPMDLRELQIAARHADPRTTTRYDRARKNLDRHPNYILAGYMASGT